MYNLYCPLHNGKIYQVPRAINSNNCDAHLVAQAILASSPFAYQPVLAFLVFIKVIRERRDMHKPLNEEFIQLNIKPVIFYGCNHAVKLISNARGHKLRLAPIHQLAFGIISRAFSLARMIADDFKRASQASFALFMEHGPGELLARLLLSDVNRLPLFFAAPPLLQHFAQYAVNYQVRVAADRRSEMRVS